MNAPFAPKRTEALNWSHRPSPFAWSVMAYGGGEQIEARFHKRTSPTGYGLGVEGILYRANDYARMQKRSHFAVMNADGSTLYAGPVLDEIEAARVIGQLTDTELVAHSKAHRQFKRENRRKSVRRNCEQWGEMA